MGNPEGRDGRLSCGSGGLAGHHGVPSLWMGELQASGQVPKLPAQVGKLAVDDITGPYLPEAQGMSGAPSGAASWWVQWTWT